jgi:hypothetical protein
MDICIGRTDASWISMILFRRHLRRLIRQSSTEKGESMMKRPMLLALSWGAFSMTPMMSTDLPPQSLPIYGGASGTSFTRSCGAGRVISGFTYRTALWVDAIGLLCRPVNANGTLGSESAVGTLAGGGGGTSGSKSCPAGSVVAWVWVSFGLFVDGVHFSCRAWDPATRTFGVDRGQYSVGKDALNSTREICENPTQPGHAIRGRSGWYVDAFGLICDEP